MEQLSASAQELREQIARAEAELKALKEQLADAESDGNARVGSEHVTQTPVETGLGDRQWKWPLKADEYERYGRQLILPSVGVEGQSLGCYTFRLRKLGSER
jgi:adenylyltransferase/sulfurtransferase